MEVETPRLIPRRPRLEDVTALFEFLGNAEAMQHTHTDATLREYRRRVAVHEWHHGQNGYAPCTIITRVNGRIIGWGGLYDDSFDPGWGGEVAYFFHQAVWGQGYESDMVVACMNIAD